MSASLSIIRLGKKCMITYTGNEKSLAEALTGCALRDEVIAEAITRTAVEIEMHRQTSAELIKMTKK